MVSRNNVINSIALFVSILIHASLFGGGWYFVQQYNKTRIIEVDNVLGWEWLEYVPEQEHVPEAAPLPPPPGEPEPETEQEPEVEQAAPTPEPVAPVEIEKPIVKKEITPPRKTAPPKKEKIKPEKPKEKPKKDKPKPKRQEEISQDPLPQDKPLFVVPPPRATVTAPSLSNIQNNTGVSNDGKTGKPNGGSQTGSKETAHNYNCGLQDRINSAVQRRKGRIRDRGTAVVSFDIQSNGQFSNIRIESSSGVEKIDSLILESVRSVGRYTPPPEGHLVSKRIPLNVR
ncbi:MAG: TonB family protein [Cardiobacteriaceae bacterium]|nr:TonB family protein [Cardiobacteriaceae bacterium]